MRKTKKCIYALPALLAACTLALSFASCSNSDDDDDPATELSGTSWTESDGGVYTFTDDTATYTITYDDAYSIYGSLSNSYSYTCDSTSKRIYLTLKSQSAEIMETPYSWTDANTVREELVALKASTTVTAVQTLLTQDYIDWIVAGSEQSFATPLVYSYTLDGSSLTLTPVFNGFYPTAAYTYSYSSSSDVVRAISMKEGGLEIDLATGGSDVNILCFLYPAFTGGSSGGTFAGTLFMQSGSSFSSSAAITKLGTAVGIYSTGTDASGNDALVIQFTTVPATVSAASTEVTSASYALTQTEAVAISLTKK